MLMSIFIFKLVINLNLVSNLIENAFFLSCPALANYKKIRDKIQFKKSWPNGEVVQGLVLNGSNN
jgi:hypothetical protein